jgi:excisionase family DNA binding protein
MHTDLADGPSPLPILVDIPETCRLIGCKRTLIYELLNAGRLARCKIGRRTLVTRASIERFVQDCLDANGAA